MNDSDQAKADESQIADAPAAQAPKDRPSTQSDAEQAADFVHQPGRDVTENGEESLALETEKLFNKLPDDFEVYDDEPAPKKRKADPDDEDDEVISRDEEDEDEPEEDADEAESDGEDAEADDGGEQEADGDEDEAEKPESKVPKRIRFRPSDEVEAMALEISRNVKAKGGKISLAEAEARAKAALGIEDSADESTESNAEEDAIPDDAPQSSDDAQDRIRQLREERKEAADAYDDEKLAEINGEIDRLTDLLPALEQRASRRQQEIDAQFESSMGKVLDYYPQAKDENGEFFREMQALDGAWREMGDPRADNPDKPRLIANLVAQKLGITPNTGASKPASKTVKPTAKPLAKRSPMKPGKATTPSAQASPPRPVTVNSLEDLNAETQRVLGGPKQGFDFTDL